MKPSFWSPPVELSAQDVELDENGNAKLVKGVAKDRQISIEDAEMWHGRNDRDSCHNVFGLARKILDEPDIARVIDIDADANAVK